MSAAAENKARRFANGISLSERLVFGGPKGTYDDMDSIAAKNNCKKMRKYRACIDGISLSAPNERACAAILSKKMDG